MARTNMSRVLLTAAMLCGATSLYAQKKGEAPPPAPPAAIPAPPPKPVPEPKLVFDREVYSYPGVSRRDPFKALIGKESAGPLFEDLKLRGIIYTGDPNRSLVLLQDGSRPPKLYRLHRGEVIGNSRIVEIRPLAVRFAVENFGMLRYQVLELRVGAASQEGIPTQSTPVPATKPIGDDAKKPNTTTNDREELLQPERRR